MLRTSLFLMAIGLPLVGCSNDPATNYQLGQFFNGLSVAASQQQADQDAYFYHQQRQLWEARQAQQLQTISDKLPPTQNSSGWW